MKAMKGRPMGVALLAALFALNAAFYLVLSGLAIFDLEELRAVLHALSPSGAGPEALHTAMGRLRPFYYLFMAGATAVMAVGFWKLWNWVRIVMAGMILLSLVLMVTEIRPLMMAATMGAISLTVARVGLSALWLWYLFRRSVKDAFRARRSERASSPTGDIAVRADG